MVSPKSAFWQTICWNNNYPPGARGYYQCQHTPGLWWHMWWAITFCLIIGDFGIKVKIIANFNHLKTALKKNYEVAVVWMGSLFCGVKLVWDYKRHHVNCSMPRYINKELKKYQRIPR